MFNKEINNIALSSSDDQILQIFDKITLDPCDSNVGKVCKTEPLNLISCNM